MIPMVATIPDALVWVSQEVKTEAEACMEVFGRENNPPKE